jgi:predicted S18 family serine protease
LSETLEKQIEEAKEMLLSEANFDFTQFLENLDVDGSNKYISEFEGFSVDNIELLAEYVSQIGFHNNCNDSERYLKKALQLYELSNLKSRTYSFEREKNIMTIKSILHGES